jgi:DNA polymerase III delta subunit
MDKELNDYYMFVGNEIKVMDTYIKQIVDTFDLEAIRVDNLGSVFSKLTSNNLAGKKKCYIISNDEDFAKTENEKVWDKMKDLNFQSVVIMIYNTIDKRTRFYKYHNERDLMTEFEALSSEVLKKYITKEIDLSSDYCEELIGICAGNLNKILLEVDKIKCLSDSTNTGANKAYNQLIEEGVIHVPAKDLLFPFIDAVTLGNSILSYTIWDKIKKVESSMAVLSLLYGNFRNILSVQLAGNAPGICEFTGLTPFQVKLAKDKLGIFTKEELINIIKTVRKVEKGIKIGWIDETIAIRYLLTQIFKEV